MTIADSKLAVSTVPLPFSEPFGRIIATTIFQNIQQVCICTLLIAPLPLNCWDVLGRKENGARKLAIQSVWDSSSGIWNPCWESSSNQRARFSCLVFFFFSIIFVCLRFLAAYLILISTAFQTHYCSSTGFRQLSKKILSLLCLA